MKISIVTINRNNKVGLEKTVASVLQQSYNNIEYLVIDGESRDGSVDVIRACENFIAFWVSEADNGIYHAMNKGLYKATGDYVLFLNSGDYLANSNIIERIAKQLQDEDVFYGNIGIIQNGVLHELPSGSRIEFFKRYQHNLPPHPATFIKRSLLRRLGGFDESYKIIADVVLISRIFSSEAVTYQGGNFLVTIFDTEGLSSRPENQHAAYLERKRFISKEFPQYLHDFEQIYKKSLFTHLHAGLGTFSSKFKRLVSFIKT